LREIVHEHRDLIQKYIDYGMKIIPLYPESKRPRDTGWQKKGSSDLLEILSWLDAGNNIGCNLGLSNMVVSDIDGEEGQQYIDSLNLPPTFTTKTGRESGEGKQYFFKTEEHLKSTIGYKKLKLDLMAGERQVVLPPSIHPLSKKPYQLIDGREPVFLPKFLEEKFNENLIKPKVENLTKLNKISDKDTFLTQTEGKQIPEGQRNNTLFLIGCSMRGAGAGIANIIEHLSEVNNSLCVPPLDSKEVNNIATQASNYQKGKMPGDYTSIFCGADEVDISIPGKIYEFLRKKPANDFSRSLVVYTALRQISLLNSQEKIYNYTGYIADNYGTKERYIPAIIREFNDLSILTVHEKNTENGKYVQREIEFHPSQFDGGQNE
jgi:hypothetical protein